MSELKLGPLVRDAKAEDVDNMYGETAEGFVLYERVQGGEVVELSKKPFPRPLVDSTERRVAAVRFDNNDDHVFVLAYKVIPEHQRRAEALLASARAKLTEEEFRAVQAARDASWNV